MLSPRYLLVLLLMFSIHVAQAAQKLDVLNLRAIPDGNYLVTLELEGKETRLNLKIQANRGRCVDSTDLNLKDVTAQFQAQGNGNFLARLRGGSFSATQLWIFRPDGAAAIREAPDRGEQQSAIPVADNSLEPPKK